MSWIPSSSATAAASLIQRELDHREQLEGSLLAVCAGCKDMLGSGARDRRRRRRRGRAGGSRCNTSLKTA